MRKKFLFILVSFILVLMASCTKQEKVIPGEEVILDKNMENGIGILGTVSIVDLKEIKRYYRYSDTVPSNVKPIWRLAQWGTLYDFKTTSVEEIDGDYYVISDETKEFRVNPKTGEYSLNTYTALENPEPRMFNEPWLHFIIEQNIADVSRLDEMKHIWADLDFEITQGENLMGNSFNPYLHTAL